MMKTLLPQKLARIPFALVSSLVLATLCVPAAIPASGQALPAGEVDPISTGFALPSALGSLQYAVSASQSLQWGYYGNSGTQASANLNGNLAYLSNSKQSPFSLVVSGGHSFAESSGVPGYSFASLGLSQVANVGRWNFTISDSVSYLPGTAAAGLSGVPGVGDLGIRPVQVGNNGSQGVLTNFSTRIANVVAGSVARQLTGKTAVNASGAYSITRFLDSNNGSGSSGRAGLDGDGETGQVGITHQIDPRNSFGGQYAYSSYSYSGNTLGVLAPGFVSQTASLQYSHQFTRKLAFTAAGGPQWTKQQNSTVSQSTDLYADISLTYAGKASSGSIGFVRSTNNGYGTLGGASSDGVVLAASRRFAEMWSVAGSSSYTRSSSLPIANIPAFTVNTYVEAIQVSRSIVRNLSGYASYTLEDQSASGTGAVNTFLGRTQIVSFGITYAPGALHLGHP